MITLVYIIGAFAGLAALLFGLLWLTDDEDAQ